MENPLISIIIPTYNRAHLISETLDSIITQTYTHWECIVVDDGSTDNTSEVMAKYTAKDSRFQYYHRPHQRLKGANACRNYGFELSKGDYIQWFDSDDLMVENFLKRKISLFVQKINLDLVFCGFQTFGSEFFLLKEYNLETNKCLENIFLKEEIKLNTQSFLFKREVVNNVNFDVNLQKAQDLDFLFKVLISKKCLLWDYIPNSLIKIRMHDNSISQKGIRTIKGFESELVVLKRIKLYFQKRRDKDNLQLLNIRYNAFLLEALRENRYKLYYRGLWSSEVNFLVKLVLYSISIIHYFIKRGELLTKKILN